MRWKAGLAVAAVLTLFATSAAAAKFVSLPPGSSRTVPETTWADEKDWLGFTVYQNVVPFTIRNNAGASVCRGLLFDAVVKSLRTGQMVFVSEIGTDGGSGAVNRIIKSGFGSLPPLLGQPAQTTSLSVAYYRAGWRTLVPPHKARRSSGPGDIVQFSFERPASISRPLSRPLSCATPSSSTYFMIMTNSSLFRFGGVTQIMTTSGASASVYTVRP